MSKKKRIELARYVVENCKDCQYREAAKQYLADNPVDDWQELKMSEYEIEWKEKNIIRYRKRQPEKKEAKKIIGKVNQTWTSLNGIYNAVTIELSEPSELKKYDFVQIIPEGE